MIEKYEVVKLEDINSMVQKGYKLYGNQFTRNSKVTDEVTTYQLMTKR